jgi:hypothetical protein
MRVGQDRSCFQTARRFHLGALALLQVDSGPRQQPRAQ